MSLHPKRIAGGPPGRYTLDEVRAGLEADERARGHGGASLLILCVRAGEEGETRAPGLYYRDPERRTGPTVVFTGDDPPDDMLAPFRPTDHRPGPMVVVMGPEHIDPPDDMPI